MKYDTTAISQESQVQEKISTDMSSMASSSLKDRIKKSRVLTAIARWMLMPPNEYRPRWWVRVFWNRLKHKRGEGSVIRPSNRMDVFPYNRFEIGEKTIIEDFCTINNAVGDVLIGNRTLIGMSNVIIGPVTLGNHILFAQNVVLSALNHNFEDITKPISDQGFSTKAITVDDGVWIGANAVVVPGVHIGRNSVVAAGSVVTKDVAPYTVVVGNPARPMKQYNFDTQQWEKI
jgi:acetyltransferase-like isoleucine patch superfamily enzyme